jgi:hypothetical protein
MVGDRFCRGCCWREGGCGLFGRWGCIGSPGVFVSEESFGEGGGLAHVITKGMVVVMMFVISWDA